MYVPDIEGAVEACCRRVEIPQHIIGPLRVHSEVDRLYGIAKNRRAAQIAERVRLHDKRAKLLQAHLAGAVSLDLLKSEQHREPGKPFNILFGPRGAEGCGLPSG